jgi:YgiT-type zinc finger domain-containing protein
MTDFKIKSCPNCGSDRIREQKQDVESKRGGVSFTAHEITVEACPVCGERFFSPSALEQIDAQRPKTRKSPGRRRSA